MNGSPAKNTASASKTGRDAGRHWTTASVLLFVAGLAAFVLTLVRVGPGEIVSAFAAISGAGYAVLLVYPFVSIWDVWGWRFVFPPRLRGLPVTDLFWIRLAGEALNNTTPLFDLGGEPLKVALLHRRLGVDKPTGLAATAAAKAFLFYSEVAFWICGLVPVLVTTQADDGWKKALAAFCAGALIFCALLLMAQRKGFLSACLRAVRGLAPRSRTLARLRAPLESADAAMRQVYAGGFVAPASAFFLHFAGWVAGGMETYLMFLVLGVPLALHEAVAIEALFQLTRTASGFIPASLGAQEAGMAIYAGWFGMHAPLGVAVSLLKRARQLLWSAAGFGAWAYFHSARPRPSA